MGEGEGAAAVKTDPHMGMNDVPDCLRNRPFDERRKLPVPFVHDTLDGQWDFTAVLAQRLVDCIKHRLCGQCGEPLGWWIAFLGGPVSALTGVYSDPPMHEECGRAALNLCPHINRVTMKRATKGTLPGPRTHAPEAIMDRTRVWVLTITRDYRVEMQPNRVPLLVAKSIKRRYGWRNREDAPGLVEMTEAELSDALAVARDYVRRTYE